MIAALRTLGWQMSQWQYRRGRARPFSGRPGLRVLVLSEPNRISQSQIFPFHFYRRELAERWRVELRELPTTAFEAAPDAAPGGADVVLVQTWIDLEAQRAAGLFGAIRQRHPAAKVVYMDSFAPTDLRFAAMLDPHVDLYVKKHVMRDRSYYGRSTLGDTNVTDHFARQFGLSLPPTRFEIPPGFLDKLVVGPSFCTAPRMLPHFHGRAAHAGTRARYDVHARLAANGTDWYRMMRQQAIDAVKALPGRAVLSEMGVSERQYLQEMRASRIGFSPFGYGEVCWRDYEAVLCGAMLVKPDMSHLETDPDIFVAHQTYVPVAWDLSDLAETIERYLSRDAEREAIARRAYERLHRYARDAEFVGQCQRLFGGMSRC